MFAGAVSLLTGKHWAAMPKAKPFPQSHMGWCVRLFAVCGHGALVYPRHPDLVSAADIDLEVLIS